MEKEKILEDGKKLSAMRYQQIISEAKMKCRRMELDSREKVIEEWFKKAEEKLATISTSKNQLNIRNLL